MSSLWQDLRYGIRIMRESPGFTLISILVLAIGIGFNTATYRVADALLYRPLLVPNLDRIVDIHGVRKGDNAIQPLAPADYLDWRAASRTVDHLSAVIWKKLNLTGAGEPEAFEAAAVTPGLFDALETKTALGRTFLPEDALKGQSHVVILSDAIWQSQFSRDPGVLDRRIKLEGIDYQVVGVMPRDFRYPPYAKMWIPLTPDEHDEAGFYLRVIGRLRPGVSLRQANAEFKILADRSEQKYPKSHSDRSTQVGLLRDYITSDLTASYMRLTTWAVLFVLLIACANVANLQFARMSARSCEVAVRSALGAGRIRLLRQFLTESALAGLIGSFLGVIFASWYLDSTVASMPSEVAQYLPGFSRVGLNTRVLLYAVAAGIASGLIAGIIPAVFASRPNVFETLKEGGRSVSSGRTHHRMRSMLVTSEIVLTLVLIIGAGLMASGIRKVREPNANIYPEQILTMRVDLPEARYRGSVEWRRFQQQLLPALRSLPGVQSTAVVTALPYASWGGNDVPFTVEGRPEPKPGSEPGAIRQSVSPEYFQALRIPLKRGRFLDWRDGENSPPVAVISSAAAQRHFPGEDPVGKRIKDGPAGSVAPWVTIVGVAGDVRQDPTNRGLDPALYRPFTQCPASYFFFLLRTSGNPRALMKAVRAEVTKIDRDQPLGQLSSYEQRISEQLTPFNYLAKGMGAFGIIALLLSAVGVYGVMAYSVTERRHEIGMRIALGAGRRQVLWMVARWGLHLTISGVGIGLAASFGFASLIQRLIFGVGTYDFLSSFACGALLLGTATMLACFVPVLRAMKLDPMITLRSE
jgi:putative ABC transport system permease protein